MFREENDEEIVDELPAFEDLEELYKQIQVIYEAEFFGWDYDNQVNDYQTALDHPLKYIRISYRLLQLATSLPDYPINLWSLIPVARHSIAHVPLSGYNTMYSFFKKARESQLPVPENLIRDDAFLRLTDFDMLYFDRQNKRDIWNTIFNTEKLEKEGLQLGFGMKTDGHMISVLFEKTALNFIPQNKKDLHLQQRRKNISNWTHGLYPLYKTPFGISEEDRIIGIDPGKLRAVFL